MSFDDELRNRLHRELVLERRPAVDSRAVFAELRPAMRRARRRRSFASASAIVMAVGLLGGLARLARNDDTVGSRLDPASSVLERPDDGVTPADDGSDTGSDTVEDGQSEDGSDRPGSVSVTEDRTAVPVGPIVVTPPAAVPSEDDADASAQDEARDGGTPAAPQPAQNGDAPGDDTGASGSDRTDGAVAGPSADDAATSDPVTDDPVGDAVSDDGTADDSNGAPSTGSSTIPQSTTTVAPAPSADERFDGPCGSVIADRSSGSVTIVEILPQPGYSAVVEDPDHGSVTVQFSGGGEDCEMKIPATGSPEGAHRDR
jgi:hypothetical protein